MPTLPTFTVTQTTADRLLAAFTDATAEDGSALTAVEAYKEWLRRNLINYVLTTEARANTSSLEDDLPL